MEIKMIYFSTLSSYPGMATITSTGASGTNLHLPHQFVL